MKLFPALLVFLLLGCKSKKVETKKAEAPVASVVQDENYFPVTVYIKGQINDIRLNAVNPLRLDVKGSRTDSSWLKVESLDTVFNDFLSPVIDTANFKKLFSESKFLDNSIGAYTWTYEPMGALPDTQSLKKWTVYVDPSTNKVTRIFMVKGLKDNTQLQLTWLSDSCSKVLKIKDSAGQAVIEKETIIKWDFE